MAVPDTHHSALSIRPDRAIALLTVVLMASWLEGLWTWLLAAAIAEVDGQTAPSLAFLGLVIFLSWLASRALSLVSSPSADPTGQPTSAGTSGPIAPPAVGPTRPTGQATVGGTSSPLAPMA